MPFPFCVTVVSPCGSTILSVVTCSGNIRFLGSIGSVSVTGLNTFAVSVLNSSIACCVSSVGGMPRLDKSIRSNMVGDRSCCGVLVLGVLVVVGVHAGVAHLLKGDVNPGLGPVPVMHR